jgi:ferredoxin
MSDSQYTLSIIRKKCVGDGACCDIAPYVFDMDDEACAIVLDPPLKHTSDEKILEAARACPVDAVVVHDRTSSKQLWPEE